MGNNKKIKALNDHLCSMMNSWINKDKKERQKNCKHRWKLYHLNAVSISEKCSICGKVRYLLPDGKIRY